ncbi:MAG: hypothetical protein GVY19_05685 [Bacteroidetes bacterium]|jgi:hypothetical protein|nr:hypothetical protein [Bacteroidota bacterium]
MANNKITGGRTVLLSFFAFLFLFVSHTSVGLSQKITKHYASSIQENGVLYYVFPFEGFKEVDGKGEMTYDITYHTANDSAVVHISLYSPKNLGLQSAIINYDTLRLITKLQKVLVESYKKDWHYRYKFKLTLSDLNSIFNATVPPVINITADSENIKLHIRNRKWRKQSDIVRKIINLIKLNNEE